MKARWIIALVLIVAVGAGIFFAVNRGSSTINVDGTMNLTDTSTIWAVSLPCAGSGGYADLTKGASVTVTNEKGAIIGTGTLDGGIGIAAHKCLFGFAVPSVSKAKFYSVQVSHRGTITEPSSGVSKGSLTFALTIGS